MGIRRRSPIDPGFSLSGAPKDGTPITDSIRSAAEKSNTMGENSGKFFYDDAAPAGNRRRDARGSAAEAGERATAAADGVRLSAGADGNGFDLAANERNSPDTSERSPQRATVYRPEGAVSAGSIRDLLKNVNSERLEENGRAINADTGRPISWGHTLRGETYAHGTKSALESIKGIDRIIETAVLLDTVAANPTGKSKLPGTAFMRSLYSLVDDGNRLTLYRLFAEEAVPARGGEPFTRAYELKEIKEVATTPDSVLSVSGGLTNGAPATTYTIADLFAFVKENVPDFQPKPVHPAMLNADGTPRAVRQGVDAALLWRHRRKRQAWMCCMR